MLKTIFLFVFGNAFWDKLVEFFGSTDAVIEAAVLLLLLVFCVKFFREIAGLAAVILILWLAMQAGIFQVDNQITKEVIASGHKIIQAVLSRTPIYDGFDVRRNND